MYCLVNKFNPCTLNNTEDAAAPPDTQVFEVDKEVMRTGCKKNRYMLFSHTMYCIVNE